MIIRTNLGEGSKIGSYFLEKKRKEKHGSYQWVFCGIQLIFLTYSVKSASQIRIYIEVTLRRRTDVLTT